MTPGDEQDPGYAIRYSWFTRILFWILVPVPWFAVFLLYGAVMPRRFLGHTSALGFFGLMAVSYVLSTVIHEGGHALAARQVGLPIVRIFVWPVLAERGDAGWRFRWKLSWRYGDGYVQTEESDNYFALTWMCLCGPLANLAAYVLTFPVLYLLGPEPAWLPEAITLFGLMNALSFYYALNPRGKHPLTDGDWIVIALFLRRRQLLGKAGGA